MPEKLKANYVDHICIAVNDVKKAEKDYIDASAGMSPTATWMNPRRSG